MSVFDGCQHDPPHEHGESRTYRTHKCRCDDCKAANAALLAAWRRKRAYGQPTGFVPADETREHLTMLLRSGMALTRIGELVGMDDRSLACILYPRKGRPPRARVSTVTRDKVLAVEPPRYVHEVSGRAFVTALGTVRRLNALHAIGWSTDAVARESGVHGTTLNALRRRKRTTLHTATAIARTYDRLWDQSPPAATRFERAAVTRTLRRAAAHGWAPPMAWDDADLDRSAGRPHARRAA